MNPNNGDEGGNDITGFGQGLPSAQQYPLFQGGLNPGLQPFLQGEWTAALQALNQVFMPLQQPASSPVPHSQNEHVATTVESVDSAAVMKESQGDGEGASVEAGRRRKGAPGRSKLSNFSPQEDVFLVKSWLEISCDPIVNTGQKKEGFWARIKGQYDNKRGTFHERSVRSLQSHWETIKAESSKFSGYMVNVIRDNPSGMSDADKVSDLTIFLLTTIFGIWQNNSNYNFLHCVLFLQTSLALSNFAAIEQYPYIYMHCWELLKDEPKWMELKGTRPGDNEAIADHIPTGATDINRDPETPPSQYAGSKRPMGRDAAKKAAKKSASSSPSESSQYASKLQDLSIHKISIWEEENAKKGSRYEQRVAIESERYNEMRHMESQRYEEACQHNKKMASIEEEKLQIMRKKADREQTHEEERILGIDLDKCIRRLRKYYEKKQQKIQHDIGINEDDN